MEDTDSVNLSTFQATIPNERDMSITYGGSDVTGLKELTIDNLGSRSSRHGTHIRYMSPA